MDSIYSAILANTLLGFLSYRNAGLLHCKLHGRKPLMITSMHHRNRLPWHPKKSMYCDDPRHAKLQSCGHEIMILSKNVNKKITEQKQKTKTNKRQHKHHKSASTHSNSQTSTDLQPHVHANVNGSRCVNMHMQTHTLTICSFPRNSLFHPRAI